MTRRHDLRPTTPADSLKRIVRAATNKDTVPHGTKVAKAGEATIYTDSTGERRRVDGDRVAGWEVDIADAQARVEQAEVDLEAARARIDEAEGRIGTSEATLSALEGRVTDAEVEVADAADRLSSVDSRLTTTAGDLDALEGVVVEVDGRAVAAGSAAAAAQSTAEAAVADAEAAQAAADAAKLAARDAARNAANMVDDGGFERGTDGKTLNVGSTGSSIVDGAADAHGGDAFLRLLRTTGYPYPGVHFPVQFTADRTYRVSLWARVPVGAPGGQSLYWRVNFEDSTGANKWRATSRTIPNDGLWHEHGFDFDTAAERDLALREPVTVWVQHAGTQDDPAAAIDVDDVAVRDVTEARALEAAATAAQEAADAAQADATAAQSTADAAKSTADTAKSTADAAAATAESKSTNYFATTTPTGTASPGDLWFRRDASNRVIGLWEWVAGVGWQARTVSNEVIANLDVGKLTAGDAELGTAVAQKIAAGVGEFVEVRAANVEVTGELASRLVSAMDIATKKLVVTDEAILQHTTLLGTTVADELNVRKLLRGRDAILTGTLDVDQLNVTGEMSAAIVNAMTTQTKQLVVTDEAILNRATVIEGIVTPELVADRINVGELGADLMTAGALTVSDPAGSVKLSGAGLVAQDAALDGTYTRQVKVEPTGIRGGTRTQQTFNLDGVDNWVTGAFKTAETGQRVEMHNYGSTAAVELFASQSTGDHASVWYESPDSDVLNSVARFAAMTDNYTRNSPALQLWPMRGAFGFQGRWAQDTDSFKFVEAFSASPGVAAGGSVELTVPYRTPFPTNNSMRAPFYSAETMNRVDVNLTLVRQYEDRVTIRITNLNNSQSTGWMYVRIVTFNFST